MSTGKSFRITHPFHPQYGTELNYVEIRVSWSEERVYYYDGQPHLKWIPLSFTDLAPAEPFVEASAGRAYFRFAELVELAERLEEWRSG